MLIPLGILASSGGGAGGSYELISTTILGSTTASVTFDVTGLGSTYKHLQIRYTARGDSGNAYSGIRYRLNSDSGSNYSTHMLKGDGGSVGSYYTDTFTGLTTGGYQVEMVGNGATANAFAAGVFDLLDAFSTTKYKTSRAITGRAISDSQVALISGSWRNTAAVTSIQVAPTGSSNFLTGSRFSIYGIKG